MGVANIDLRGEALPEIADAEDEPTTRTTYIPRPGRTPAVCRSEPPMAGGCPLTDFKAIRCGLGKRIVAEGGDIRQPFGDSRAERRHGRRCCPCNLCVAHVLPGIAPQAGQPFYGFAEYAAIVAAEPDVAVIKGIPHRYGEPHSYPTDKVAVLVGIIDQRMDHADGGGVEVAVEPYGKRQQIAPGGSRTVCARRFDNHPDGAGVFHYRLTDFALEAIAP